MITGALSKKVEPILASGARFFRQSEHFFPRKRKRKARIAAGVMASGSDWLDASASFSQNRIDQTAMIGFREGGLREGESQGAPWGLFATIGFGMALMLLWLGVEAAVIAALAPAWVSGDPWASEAAVLRLLAEKGGLVLSLTTLATATVTTGAVVGLARLRPSLPVGSYLALRPVASGELLRFLGLALLAAAAIDGVTWLSGRAVVPAVMVEAFRSAHSPLLYWSALVLAAPLSEEILFRGFLFKGILHSRFGATGAVVVTSFAWAVVHQQYEPFYLVIVFAVGLLLGHARLASGSLAVPLAMHALLNLIATMETFLVVRSGG
jgi:uncharacterized protein